MIKWRRTRTPPLLLLLVARRCVLLSIELLLLLRYDRRVVVEGFNSNVQLLIVTDLLSKHRSFHNLKSYLALAF
jgi:hypothetical protein